MPRQAKKKAPLCGAYKNCRSDLARAHARKLLLELLDAASRVYKALFAGVRGVGVARHVARDHVAVHAVDFFDLLALHRGAGDKARTAGYVYKADGMEVGMDFVFHSAVNSES